LIQDKILFEILSNRFQAIVDEMAQVIYRTAHTVFVKETQDFGSVLVTVKGEVFAAPRRYGVLNVVGTPMDDAIRCVDGDVQAGDIFMSNDPESTKGMATHLSDVYLWKPVLCRGDLICYAWSFVHASDVGGCVPGSIAPSSYEVYQEGIRVPPQKLFRGGVLNKDLLDLFLANSRVPDQNWGDLKACVSGLNTAERRVHELLDRYGPALICEAIESVVEYAESQARRLIEHVPDGTYSYVDYIEADMVDLGLVRLKLDLTVDGDEMILDFAGTDPQVRAAFNVPTYAKDGHSMLVTALVNWLCTLEPAIPYNAGLVRPFKVHIPAGTLLNADPGAAYGARYSTSQKVCDMTMGALSQAVPTEVPSFDSGQGSILLVAVPDLDSGTTRVSVVQPIVGGSGARPTDDGIDGTMIVLNFLRNIPTEALENDMPSILIHHYGLRPDSGGPGRYRGGAGIEIELQTFSPYTTITSRCMEHYIFPPPGRLGGLPGAKGYTLLRSDAGGEEDIGKVDVLHLDAGERLRIGTPGGGGFGDPLDRPAGRVAEDVRNGLVSARAGKESYGVVLDEWDRVSEEQTSRLRTEMRRERSWTEPPVFTYGHARDAYRQRWTVRLEDSLNEVLKPLPTLARQFYHHRLKREINDRFERGEQIRPAQVARVLEDLKHRLESGFPSFDQGD